MRRLFTDATAIVVFAIVCCGSVWAQGGTAQISSSNPAINVNLEIGQVAEQVEVQADAAPVETRSTGVNQVIDNVRVMELPLNGRNVQELIILSFGNGRRRRFAGIGSESSDDQNFGRILSAADPRIMQFALKYVF
jgi:hypothetical protein